LREFAYVFNINHPNVRRREVDAEGLLPVRHQLDRERQTGDYRLMYPDAIMNEMNSEALQCVKLCFCRHQKIACATTTKNKTTKGSAA